MKLERPMKNKIIQVVKWIQENQNGLFKIAVLIILVYWSFLLCDIRDNTAANLWGIENAINEATSKLIDIDSTLSMPKD